MADAPGPFHGRRRLHTVAFFFGKVSPLGVMRAAGSGDVEGGRGGEMERYSSGASVAGLSRRGDAANQPTASEWMASLA